MAEHRLPTAEIDEVLVERLIAAVQTAVAKVASDRTNEDNWIEVPAPELTTALLSVLASVVETAPGSATPRGIRLAAEGIGKELLQLMRDVRRLRTGDAIGGGTARRTDRPIASAQECTCAAGTARR